MALFSSIEWTESTWNPLTGCTKISPGCRNCYAERLSKRLQHMGSPNYVNGFKLTTHEKALILPLKWSKSQTIFVNSMSDLFHEETPDEFIFKVFDIMNKATWHCYQILTKRAERLQSLSKRLPWLSNIWMGVTVENADYKYRIDLLRDTEAHVKFLSLEPLLGPIPSMDLRGIDWVIVGGESGPESRRLEASWVTNVRDQCLNSAVPFFFKQWGGINKKKNGRDLCGRIWDQMPKPHAFMQPATRL
jgi:protein gp37